LSSEELILNSTKIANFLIPRGVIGCYLSHRKFWQLVVDKNLPSAIVFEDDVHLANNFKGNLLEYLNVVENEKKKNSVLDYDVLLLGAIGRVHPESAFILSKYILYIILFY
jgi:GR25 family glycosyltransferase involved in LPS biosynthesis